MNDALAPPFETKVAILVRDDLRTWQRLNVTAFLASGLATANPRLMGEPYLDADGQEYLPLLGIPVLVFEGAAEQLRAVVAIVAGTDPDLVGLAVHGPKNAVDKVLKGAHLHP